MSYKPRPGERVRALLANALSFADVTGVDLPNNIEGEVVSVNETKGILVVRDEDGDWNCLLVGAFPLSARKQAHVGDYVRATLVTCAPAREVDVDLVEGLVIETRDDGSELLLLTPQGKEFFCHAEGAVIVDQSTLGENIIRFIGGRMRRLR